MLAGGVCIESLLCMPIGVLGAVGSAAMKGLQSVAVFVIGAVFFCQQAASADSDHRISNSVEGTISSDSTGSHGGDSGQGAGSSIMYASTAQNVAAARQAETNAASHKLQCYTQMKAVSMLVVVTGLLLFGYATAVSKGPKQKMEMKSQPAIKAATVASAAAAATTTITGTAAAPSPSCYSSSAAHNRTPNSAPSLLL